jgi:hypothetical protein
VGDTIDISAYRHLWDGSEEGWVLYRVGSPRGTLLVPFNTRTRATVDIDDPEIAQHVARRMKYAGVPVLRQRAGSA